MKNVFVNATAATVGGIYTILNQFYENACNDKRNINYYIFVPLECELKSQNNVYILPIKAKKYFDRIKWDIVGMKKWSIKNNIKPDLIFSLQNTGVNFYNIPQCVYIHQPLPFSKDSNWSLFKKDERKMWFYKYLYKIWIKITVKKRYIIFIQTKWMKDALIQEGYMEENIIQARPFIRDINIEKVEKVLLKEDNTYFFYPAAEYKYKNHEIIISAINELKKENFNELKHIKVIFTLDKKSNTFKKVEKLELIDNFVFIGNLEFKEVLKYYKSTDVLLFPSYIETYGLPLIEASKFQKRIVVSDCSYSREVLNGYRNVDFIKYDDVKNWKNILVSFLTIKNNNKIEIKNTDIQQNDWQIIFDYINQLI